MVKLKAMDVSQYYVTTLTAAFKNLAPILLFLVGGYIVFIKIPFLFFLKSMKNNKQDFELGQDWKNDYSLNDYEDFQRRMKILNNNSKQEGPKKKSTSSEEPHKQQKFKQKDEGDDQRKHSSQRKEKKIAPAEAVFNLSPGEAFTKQELKKKYHELLKMNHPDKVASLGQKHKIIAEAKTKEINAAYIKLKSRAA